VTKTILITGATDGIGLLTAKALADQGHTVLLHGRNEAKLAAALAAVAEVGGNSESYLADLSRMADVETMAEQILAKHKNLDVLINNAGILKSPQTRTEDGLDIRFVVNTLAPYVLTRHLLPIIPQDGRVVNLSSAAQAPVDVVAMAGQGTMDDMDAYAQSKLAITIWSREMAKELPDGPVVVPVNPGSLLASKMVKEGFGIAGNDMQIGVDILCRAALSDEFATASGKYFDNDAGRFNQPHAAALDAGHAQSVMDAMEEIIRRLRQVA
jgi:NAD(P)-dependent dehydrogenase (short-subunit alcohol dehydrogenase family)